MMEIDTWIMGKIKKNLGNTECILVRREGPISINDCELIHRF